MKAGVIGYGYWGKNILRNLVSHPDITNISLCDQDSRRAQAAKNLYPFIDTTTDYDRLLQDPEVEMVCVVTPVDTHFDLAKRALEAGKHVLLEKPMTMNYQEALQLTRLAKDQSKTLLVDHTFLYTPAVQKINQLIQNNELGDLWYIDSVRINLGLYQHDVNVVWDLAAHDISTILYTSGRWPVGVSVQGTSHAGGANPHEDIAYVTLRFEDSFIAHLHLNWLSPTKIRQTIVGGSKKMVLWDDLNPSEKIKIFDSGITIRDEKGEASVQNHKARIEYRTGDIYSPALPHQEALGELIRHFVACVKGDEKPISDGVHGMSVVKVLEACQMSIKERGAFIEIPEPEIL